MERSAALEGDLTAFFAQHYDRLVRLAALVCHSPSTTEDAVQAAMEQAWRRRTTLRDPASIRSWLDRIVVRESIRLNARPWWTKLAPGGSHVHEIELVSSGRDDDDREAFRAQSNDSGPDPIWIALTIAFRGLPVEQRAVVALHLYAGYSIEETARLTGSGVETTRSRLRLARQRLRRDLGEDDR